MGRSVGDDVSLRNIGKSFYRSGFRGWIKGPLSILRPQPGKVKTKVLQPALETIITQPNVVAKADIPVVTTTIIYSE